MITCQDYLKDITGALVPCPGKALRLITFQDQGGCISGRYCVRHAMALRRQEVRGQLEILVDEPLEAPVLEAEVSR